MASAFNNLDVKDVGRGLNSATVITPDGKDMRAAIYLRTNAGTDQLARQRELAEGYCAEQGWEPPLEYVDSGPMGEAEERAGLCALLEDAARGGFDVLVVTDLSRLSRQSGEVLSLIDRLDRCRVGVVSLREKFNSGEPAGGIVLQLVAAMSHMERPKVVERMRAGRDARASERDAGRGS
jgi:site-specific DNA recombinase